MLSKSNRLGLLLFQVSLLVAGCQKILPDWKPECKLYGDDANKCTCPIAPAASNPEWGSCDTTCCLDNPQFQCNTKPSQGHASCGPAAVGGSSGNGGSPSTGGTTSTTTQPAGEALVTLVDLSRDVLVLEPCQPFNITWAYANLGTAAATAATSENTPILRVVRWQNNQLLVDKNYPWAAGLVPHQSGTTNGLEDHSHLMSSGLDPGVVSGIYADAAGWDVSILQIPTVGIAPMNITVASADPGPYAGNCAP